MTALSAAPRAPSPWLKPSWSNWRLACVVAALVIVLAILGARWLGLALDVAFWVSLAAGSVAAPTIAVNALGRYSGALLLAAAAGLLFVMNIFPVMWSFGLSFFDYKANRIKSLSFIGFDNYARVLNDVD